MQIKYLTQMHSFSSFWQVLLPCYLPSMLHHLQAMNMIFLKVFLICMFNDPYLAENLTNLAENLEKSWTPQSSWSYFFSDSVLMRLTSHFFFGILQRVARQVWSTTLFLRQIFLFNQNIFCMRWTGNIQLLKTFTYFIMFKLSLVAVLMYFYTFLRNISNSKIWTEQ